MKGQGNTATHRTQCFFAVSYLSKILEKTKTK